MYVTATGPTPLVAGVSAGSSFGVEPSILAPEVWPGACGGASSFGVRLGVIVRGDRDLILRGLRFSYTDRFGARALPTIMPIPTLTTPFPTSSMVPSAAPVPVPGFASFPEAGVLVPGGSHKTFPYFIRFDCGVVSDGIIVIVIDTSDRHGTLETSELRVRVGT
jgi:hypothetical protein